jgi:hypothetical protein
MNTLFAMSRAITWCSPKVTKSQLPFRQWGVKPTVSASQVYNTWRAD